MAVHQGSTAVGTAQASGFELAQRVPVARVALLWISAVAVAALGAAVVNVEVFLAFDTAGATYENTMQPEPVGVPAVLFLTVVPMVIGMSAATLLPSAGPARLPPVSGSDRPWPWPPSL